MLKQGENHPDTAPDAMMARDPHESHRAATPLELLYDLVFVVAIAQAAVGLHHAISHGHWLEGTQAFAMVFFSIWWAWMSFTWFASAFDPDDALYRVKVFVQMIGLLVLAAGVSRVFEHHDFVLIVVGYVIMRVGMVAQWLRAARANPTLRTTCLRYAVGITLCQFGWIGFLFLPDGLTLYAFLLLGLLELLVPAWAEAFHPTTWHHHHIAERYGLLTIIVIGESVLASTLAVKAAIEDGHASPALWCTIVAAPIIFYTMWWIYFAQPFHTRLKSTTRQVFYWGYVHYFVFGSAAAVGAALAVAVDYATDHSELDAFWTAQAVAIPIAVFLVSLAAISSYGKRESLLNVVAAVLLLVGPFLVPLPLFPALILVVLTACLVYIESKKRAASGH